MIASSAGSLEIVSLLINKGADVNHVNGKGQASLHYAASKNHPEIARKLLSHGADVNVKDRANQHPLYVYKLLINPDDGKERAKTRLNTSDRIGNTPLHLAIESGHAATAVLLIEAGADRERQNYDQQTPEEIEGVGGQEHRRLLEYIKNACGPRT
ncbi:hypothetical protein E3Q22_04114 [Wallemia mellicola]|uniref:Uncharacterized protein n=1 Tax=Wallemia mellicola TaxID=1708541 RepID=A0A4T0N7M6_9BASI|nr:hypothetical protein E3Q23_04105 [Wallemia mellicola]TIB74520.1 hypothetical protein E3Q24_00498 [Wallemia mellicola]TIB74900.1 hypothetical protein E3Q22_04114 [Wallemia mellicola]TIB85181.1 hypothetical protein E3Q19_04266 [Wallemia mellicola]TIB89916.1 hypothetical protein E3Q21_00365 [Wallemia mellicola]